jgi:hypothetical protein
MTVLDVVMLCSVLFVLGMVILLIMLHKGK